MLFSGILYLAFKSWGMAIACFISGIFIDLDHVIDYVIQFGFNFKFKKFFQMCNDEIPHKVYFLFHGWELLILLSVTAWLSDWNPLTTGVLIGFGQHIVLDNINNRANIKSYSLLWRWQKGFNVIKVFPKNFSKKIKTQM
jgi:hypothetical protein